MCHFRECDKEGCACNTGIFYVFLCYGHSYHPERIAPKLDICPIGGYFQIRRSGGLDLTSGLEANFGARSGQVHQMGGASKLGPHIKFGGKLWGKVRPSSPNKRKNLGSSVTTRRRSWKKSPHSVVISEIQRVKFGVIVIYIFWRQNLGLQQEF